ncbi:MAG: hypothetical protein J6K62_01265 [Clostridia bacterium]|nr:hypothetical protein [Clostridia bacterium]
MSEQNKVFEYNYSAKEQAEIKRIREKYEPPRTESKLEQLRRLDAGVTQKASVWALVVGVVGALVMGGGMSLVMTDLGDKLGLPYAMAIGVVLGVIGLVGVALAYPLYNRVVAKERERIAPEILRLTEELMK